MKLFFVFVFLILQLSIVLFTTRFSRIDNSLDSVTGHNIPHAQTDGNCCLFIYLLCFGEIKTKKEFAFISFLFLKTAPTTHAHNIR